MKICSACKEEKPNTSFHKSKQTKDGLFPYCRVCRREKSVYNPATRKTSNDSIREDRYIRLMEYLKTHPCIDCGETDLLTLEFDHRNPAESRHHRITTMVTGRFSWEKIQEEIAKCDVRCANCHRRKTYERSNSWRYQYVKKNSGL